MSLDVVKKLRLETQASIGDCNVAVREAGGDYQKALEIIRARGLDRASKKASRSTGAGLVEAYVHGGGRIGVLVELQCETDFVARNERFRELAHELALQISAMDPQDVEALLTQPYIKDASRTVGELVQSAIGTLGENIKVGRFVRFEI